MDTFDATLFEEYRSLIYNLMDDQGRIRAHSWHDVENRIKVLSPEHLETIRQTTQILLTKALLLNMSWIPRDCRTLLEYIEQRTSSMVRDS